MVANVTKHDITVEKYRDIQQSLLNSGYFTHEYVMPARTVETTTACPNCGNFLNLYRAGTSYRIYCNTENCVDVGARGL
jgi:hypothetical protein